MSFDGWKARLDEVIAEIEQTDKPEVVAVTLVQVKEMIAALKEAADQIEARYIAIGPKQAEYTGVGVVEIKHSTKRTAWDHQSLKAVVVARARDERALDEETGEFEDEGSAVSRVLFECMTPSWKVTGLRGHGIDPSEYCHESDGGRSVMILKP